MCHGRRHLDALPASYPEELVFVARSTFNQALMKPTALLNGRMAANKLIFLSS
jgi:hypothetical protein